MVNKRVAPITIDDFQTELKVKPINQLNYLFLSYLLKNQY